VGIDIVRRALQTPVRQIAENAGVDDSIVVGKLQDKGDPNYGYDAQSGEYVDIGGGSARYHRSNGGGEAGEEADDAGHATWRRHGRHGLLKIRAFERTASAVPEDVRFGGLKVYRRLDRLRSVPVAWPRTCGAAPTAAAAGITTRASCTARIRTKTTAG
jgi:hypothetical protein